MKVVINRCFGGFSLSHAAIMRYAELKGGKYEDDSYFSGSELERNDPLLVKVVEELGKGADGSYAKLEIVVIPDGVEWEIEEYDGNEHVAEKHRTWS